MNHTPLIFLMVIAAGVFVPGYQKTPGNQKSPGYQKIILDNKYNNVQAKGAPAPLHYLVKAGNGLIIDCSHYDFSAIKNLNDHKSPDAIHLVCKSGTFDIPLNTTGETAIDAKTAQPFRPICAPTGSH